MCILHAHHTLEKMTLSELIDQILKETPEGFDYEWLGDFVRRIDWQGLQWLQALPTADNPEDYGRNIISLEPFELVLLHWPPGVESAVHLHNGFWGYVLCLEGTVENVAFDLSKEGQLSKNAVVQAQAGGILPEPDGTIHLIRNGSQNERLVTLHFYSPALDNLDGLKLYDLATGTIKICNEQATSASLDLTPSCYKEIEHGAFQFMAHEHGDSHELIPILPKPESDEISRLIRAYYNEQASTYDSHDARHSKRKKYTHGINCLIAEGLKSIHKEDGLKRVLHVACGTGRRALEIQELTGINYAKHGFDMSPEMVEIAESRGLVVTSGHLLENTPPQPGGYDAITFLYAYGHLSDSQERFAALKRLHQWLRPGGRLYFDAFNIDNPYEWGHQAKALHETYQMGKQGYEAGDVFYRRKGGESMAFLHYSSLDALMDILNTIGFDTLRIEHVGYSKQSGELVSEGGNLFLEVQKSHH